MTEPTPENPPVEQEPPTEEPVEVPGPPEEIPIEPSRGGDSPRQPDGPIGTPPIG